MSLKREDFKICIMRTKRVFSMGCGITTPPTDKSTALNTRYKDWWYVPGHRQHSGVIDVYEKGKD